MDLGCFLTPYFPDRNDSRTNAAEIVSRAELAAGLGYDYAEIADHHVTPDGQFFQNVPTAGRLSAVFDRLAVLFLLPLYHPLFVAEYLGTLGAFTDRLDLWCALGDNQASFDALGIDMADRVGRFEEALQLVDRLLDEEAVAFDGEHYAVETVSVSPRTDVRLCVGGLARPAIERAGRLGDAWIAHPTESLEDLERKIGWYVDAGGDRVIARRDALVLESRDEAAARAADLLEEGYRGWPADAEWPIVGDRESVAQELGRLADVGVDEVVVGVMDDGHAEETIREFAGGAKQV